MEKGFSEKEAVAGAGLMLIFFAGPAADDGVAVGTSGVDVVECCSISPLFSGFGFAGPDNFSIRRRRIYMRSEVSLRNTNFVQDPGVYLFHLLLIRSLRGGRWLLVIVHDATVQQFNGVLKVNSGRPKDESGPG